MTSPSDEMSEQPTAERRADLTAEPLDDLFPPEITALLVASGYSVLGWVDLNRLNLETTETR